MTVRKNSEKIGLKENMRVLLKKAPKDVVSLIDLGGVNVSTRRSGAFDLILFFAITRKQFQDQFPILSEHLKEKGMLWLCWPKSKKLNSDLSLPVIIKMGYAFGMVESKTISLNETWSAIKFTKPRQGKNYNNSYGTLKKKTSQLS